LGFFFAPDPNVLEEISLSVPIVLLRWWTNAPRSGRCLGDIEEREPL